MKEKHYTLEELYQPLAKVTQDAATRTIGHRPDSTCVVLTQALVCNMLYDLAAAGDTITGIVGPKIFTNSDATYTYMWERDLKEVLSSKDKFKELEDFIADRIYKEYRNPIKRRKEGKYIQECIFKFSRIRNTPIIKPLAARNMLYLEYARHILKIIGKPNDRYDHRQSHEFTDDEYKALAKAFATVMAVMTTKEYLVMKDPMFYEKVRDGYIDFFVSGGFDDVINMWKRESPFVFVVD